MKGIVSLLLCYILMPSQANAASTFTFQEYDVHSNTLYMNLVTPTIYGDVLLKVGEEMKQFENAQFEDLFILSVQVPCELLKAGATLYWATDAELVHANIPAQSCQVVPKRDVPQQGDMPAPTIQVFEKDGICWVDLGKNSLWQAATQISAFNKATVYQNIYALFLVNKEAFAGEDINRLTRTKLRCPPDQLFERISPEQAYRMFKEQLEFQLRKSTQKTEKEVTPSK